MVRNVKDAVRRLLLWKQGDPLYLGFWDDLKAIVEYLRLDIPDDAE